MTKKIEPFHCPFCGCEYAQIIGSSVDPTADAKTGIAISIDLICEDCGEEFTDFYDAAYVGYCSRKGVYNDKGDEIPQ